MSFLNIDLKTRNTRFVLFTLGLVILWNFSSSLIGLGWITATIITFLVIAIDVGYIFYSKDLFLLKLFFFSLVTGFVEIFADHWLVYSTSTLVYNSGGPFLLSSPLYMPFAWCVVLFQLGYIGLWLVKRFGMIFGSILIAVIGAVNIPLYEEWARGADWWYYQNTSMLDHTPWYIILGEFFIVLVLPYILTYVHKARLAWIFLLGIFQGLWIWFSYAIAYYLISLLFFP